MIIEPSSDFGFTTFDQVFDVDKLLPLRRKLSLVHYCTPAFADPDPVSSWKSRDLSLEKSKKVSFHSSAKESNTMSVMSAKQQKMPWDPTAPIHTPTTLIKFDAVDDTNTKTTFRYYMDNSLDL